MKNRIAFIVATQYDNVGDLLINKCLIRELTNHGEVYLDLKNVPEGFKKLLLSDIEGVYELKQISSNSFKGVGVLGLFFNNAGITHIFKSPGPFGSGGSFVSFLKNLLIGVIFSAFKLRGVKSFMVGNDIHYKDRFDRLALNLYSRNTNKLLCRSYNNVNALKTIGLKNVDYIPDMCFGFSPNSINPNKENHIGISFRELNDPEYHAMIVQSIQNLINRDIKITFFYQVERDYSYNYQLFNLFKDCENISFAKDCLKWSELSFYNSFSFTISNRLHVLLLGLVHGAIPLALLNSDAKTQKIIDIFESVNLNEFILNSVINEGKYQSLFMRRESLQEVIYHVNDVQKEKLSKEIADLF